MPRNIVETRVASCYGKCVSAKRASLVVAALVGITTATGAGCSRSGLLDGLDTFAPEDSVVRERPGALDASAGATILADAGRDATVTRAPTTHGNGCTPKDEVCNGIDDDCNGQVDDGLPPIPCAAGGEQYCVAGRYSACPTRCDACIPGSERVCFLSYCDHWAVQTCASDGRSFGVCREHHVPSECKGVASAHQDSPELEQCCLDSGYCCRDEFDLDHDGNTGEMLGNCDEVSCQ